MIPLLLSDQIGKRDLPKVKQGDTVIAKHKNGRCYQCKITDIDQQLYCEVDFDDGSFSNDLLPEDIKVNFLMI